MKQRAGFGVRAAALVIDVILLGAISIVIGLIAGSSLAALVFAAIGMQHGDAGGAAIASGFVGIMMSVVVALLVSAVLALPYNLMEAFFGWTPGKLAMGLRVRNEDGSNPLFGQVFMRWLIKHNAILLGLLVAVGIPLGFLSPILQAIVFFGCFLALGPARQALHDQLTKTAVYELAELNGTELDTRSL